jgi:flagellar motility protein MotE (MotC chaperone)
MIRVLQSSWLAALAGCLLYLGVTAALLSPAKFAGLRTALNASEESPNDDPSWRFRNPEIDEWVAEMKREKTALALREQQLKDLQVRLQSDRQELNTATQTVYQLQAEFDKNVLRIKDQEVENLKRQAKILSTMSPDAAASLVKEMPEDDSVRILFTMKVDDASVILENLSKLGKSEAQLAATITERTQKVLPPDPKARPKTSP